MEKPKFNLETDVPWIHNTNELSNWLRKSYVIEDYLVDDETYDVFLKRIMNLIKGSFTIRECREYPIKFKFHNKDKKSYTLQLRHFAINLILWNPFIELHGLDVLNSDFIIKPEEIPKIEEYVNYKLIETLRDYNVKNTTINYRISDVLYNLRLISIDFSLLLGLNFSAMTFFDMYENNDEIRDIMEVTFSDDMQPHDIESKLSELQSKEIEIYKSEPDNPIGVILNANTGIKHKQFAEFTISEGLKPSLEGVTIPKPIENSTLLRGLDRPSYLYIDATGSRKSLVIELFVTLTSNSKKINLFNCWKLLRA